MRPVTVIIVGADALLAARPATAIQLWHACLGAGYDLAVPATWGDELIAAECLRIIGSHTGAVEIMCSCPMVARAVAAAPVDLAQKLVSLVAPPVATARYIRRVYGERRVHITYAGACPAAADSAIDTWLAPAELLERFVTTGIELTNQPLLFESILPPDRRRHFSQPGGLPMPEMAAALPRPRAVRQIDDVDVDLSLQRHLESAARTLVDLAPRLGCACSGASAENASSEARVAVTELEPPRSPRPVMADPGGLALMRRVQTRRSVETGVAPGQPQAPRPNEAPEAPPGCGPTQEDRPVATTRSASHSPLSWNLRERAMPQPSTRGRSSAGWNSLQGALESAGASAPHATEPSPVTATAATVETGGDLPRSEAVAGLETAIAKVESGASTDPGPGSAAPLPPDEPESGAAATPPHAARTTPPGGYWFVAADAPVAPDVEVPREPPFVESAPPEPLPSDDIAAAAAAEPEPGDLDTASTSAGTESTDDALDAESTDDAPGADSTDDAPDAESPAPPGDAADTGSPAPAGRAVVARVVSKADDEGPDPRHGGWLITLGILILMALMLVAQARSMRVMGSGDLTPLIRLDTTSPRRQVPPGADRGECSAGRAFHGICVATPWENRLAVRVFPPSSLLPTTALNLPLRR